MVNNHFILSIIIWVGLSIFGVAWSAEAVFDFNGYRYPVLYEGEIIKYNHNINEISYFKPQFGKDRIVVNPINSLEINNQGIKFKIPGEYYIVINKKFNLKVVVLSINEPYSLKMVRIFDFLTANLIYCDDENELKEFRSNIRQYIEDWFNSDQPGRLFCGSTQRFFRHIISDRLKYPTRIVTFPGVCRWDGKITKSSHNIVEVYLPDKNKWVLFDINYGFFVKWMGALELADYFHKNSSGDSGMITVKKLLQLDVHVGGPITYWPKKNRVLKSTEELGNNVSSIPTAALWRDAFRFYYSGAAYWGGKLTSVKHTGTEFLTGEYLFANLHKDKELETEAIEWVKSFKIKPTIIPPDKLKKLLDAGHADIIGLKQWESGLPLK